MKAFFSIFQRANAQKWLAPWERAVYKLCTSLLVLVPTGLVIGGLATLLDNIHAGVPPLVWQVLIVLVPAALLALAKYASAHGDTAVGDVLKQIEQAAEADLAKK